MAIRPTLHRAVEKTKNTASNYNDNFDLMMQFVDDSVVEAKTYVTDTLAGNVYFRNLCEIVTSTIPLTDAALHLLDGTLLAYGSYKTFIDKIADLYEASPTASYFCTETEWQAAVTEYGECGKFVYDSENNTVRLPLLTGIIQAGDVSTLGNLVEAGLPSHNHNLANNTISNQSLASAPQAHLSYRSDFNNGDYKYNLCGNSTSPTLGVSGEANNSIYGNSNTVQPQTIKVLYYIVVATGTKYDIEVDIDEIATDLNGKADTDLSNISASQSAINTITEWGMPDYENGISISSNDSSYTCPSDGYFSCGDFGATGTRILLRNGDYVYTAGSYSGCIFQVYEGDVITTRANTFYGTTYFYPLKGVSEE